MKGLAEAGTSADSDTDTSAEIEIEIVLGRRIRTKAAATLAKICKQETEKLI